jgi:hypothetical protein
VPPANAKELQPTRLPLQDLGQKKSKKSLAMHTGIVKNGVILQVLGGTMRKLKTRQPRSLPFRLLVILAGALMLLAAFTPRANADCPACIRFYDFEGPDTPPYPVGLQSHAPALEIGAATTLFLDNGTPGVAYPVGNTSQEAGLPLNVPAGAGPNLTSLGIHRAGQTNLGIEIPMPSAQGIYDVTSVSFAYDANGNGYAFVQLQISSNGGLTFTTIAGTLTFLPATPGAVINLVVPAGTTLGINNLALRLLFTGGQSNGNDLQNTFDNIQINGTIVPEPATVAGGLLGVLGLCWHQRRRLIGALRLRRT